MGVIPKNGIQVSKMSLKKRVTTDVFGFESKSKLQRESFMSMRKKGKDKNSPKGLKRLSEEGESRSQSFSHDLKRFSGKKLGSKHQFFKV